MEVVKRRSSEECSIQWTAGIAEIQLPVDELLTSSSLLFNLNYNHIMAEHPELYEGKGEDNIGPTSRHSDSVTDGAARRPAATDQLMLERFQKQQHHRLMYHTKAFRWPEKYHYNAPQQHS
ncbi:Hypothetical predicted protein [Olea europaea subsp. europaea]|uniref:Uncharacterized protein n=1 Tax=Olea europaea subsp. europaea TaxID=158383 RepID=A0A8S0RQH6_OLEEU|nr:Hypothetical predicted protein [Olea europaea subsp. europaea]